MKKHLLIVSFLMTTCSLFSAQQTITLDNARGEFKRIVQTELKDKLKVLKSWEKSCFDGVLYVQETVMSFMKLIKYLPVEREHAAAIAAESGQIFTKVFALQVLYACDILQKGLDSSSAAFVFIDKMKSFADTMARHIQNLIQAAGDDSIPLFSSLPILSLVWDPKTVRADDRFVDTALGSKVFVENTVTEIKKSMGNKSVVAPINKKAHDGTTFNLIKLRRAVHNERAKDGLVVDPAQPSRCARIAMGTMGALGIAFVVGAVVWGLSNYAGIYNK